VRIDRQIVLVLSLLGATGAMKAQTLSGYTTQESVLVPVTGAAVSSQFPLLQGVTYKLRAAGVAQVEIPGLLGTYTLADAEYASEFSGLFGLPQVNMCPFTNIAIGLAVNDPTIGTTKTPSWGVYNSAHIYTVSFTGTGAPISINYHNCSFGASQGALIVQILRPMGMNLPMTGQPGYTDVSPQLQTFPQQTQQSVSGRANALAVAANGTRLYAGTFAGVWRSDDAGLTWKQMTQAQPPSNLDAVAGGLFVPDVYDIAISPQKPDVVMIGVNGDLHAQLMSGIYRSEDGGNTWALVKQFACPKFSTVTQIVFAPDDANLVYAASGCAVGLSGDGGKTWLEKTLPAPNAVWHIAVAPFEPLLYENRAVTGVRGITVTGPFQGVRRVYALGSDQMFYSTDGGQTWIQDEGIQTIVAVTGVGGAAAPNNANSSRVIMAEPGNNQHVLLAVPGQSNGPSYYDNPQCGSSATVRDGTICNMTAARLCGEGSVWLGDFSKFAANSSQPAAVWTQLQSPPTYWGVSTPSGNSYLDVLPMGSSYLLFLSDMSHVHVSAGLPVAGGWHRIEGLDASRTAPPNPPNPYCNNLLVHVDPHALAFAPNFSMTLQAVPSGTPAPYNENKVAGQSSGDIWMANDGGVYHSFGAQGSWLPASGLATLATINVAGVAVKGSAPGLYFGTGDNANFFSLDGGTTWNMPRSDCGDCDAWFADPAQIQQVMTFMPLAGGGGFYMFTNNAKYPDAEFKPTDGTTFAHWVCPNACDASSSYWMRGYRPMVLTAANENAPATGDYVIIGTKSDGSRVVFRKTNATAMNAALDWENPANAVPYGPALPACGSVVDCIDVVQASGGHGAPMLYVGDPSASTDGDRTHFLTLWKWTPGATNWQQIVPSPSSTPAGKTAANAHRFYVDPFNPNTIYLLDDTAMKRSDDGGATWQVDASLDDMVTEHHRYSYFTDDSVIPVIKDMIFVRGEDKTRFAVGNAGVFYTLDGTDWSRLLSTSALPSHPVAAYFDDISDPCDRALYVGFAGRGILRIDPIPFYERPGVGGLRPCASTVVNKRGEP
jgi:hypothetical protein